MSKSRSTTSPKKSPKAAPKPAPVSLRALSDVRSNAKSAIDVLKSAQRRRSELMGSFWLATQGDPAASVTREAFRSHMAEVFNIGAELVNAILLLEHIDADTAQAVARVQS